MTKIPKLSWDAKNAQKIPKENARRRTYIVPHVLSKDWPEAVKQCLVNLINRPWTAAEDIKERDLDLYVEMRGFLFD